METALPRTMFFGRRWAAVVGAAAALLVLVAVVFYALTQNTVGQSPAVRPTAPSSVSTPTVTGVVRESAGDTRNEASGWVRMRNVKLVVTGTSAQGATVVRHLQADGQGQFKLSLPNGHYRIYAIAYGPANAPLAQQPHSTITVRHGRLVHVRLTVSTI